jgi:hypothetical protein
MRELVAVTAEHRRAGDAEQRVSDISKVVEKWRATTRSNRQISDGLRFCATLAK